MTRKQGPDPIDAVNRVFNGVLVGLASISLFAMMVLIVGNMLLRVVAAPFPGTFEAVGWLAAITTALALGYTQVRRGHVDIDVVTRRLPQRVQNLLKLLMTLLATGFFLLLAWRMSVMGGHLRDVGTVSDSLRVPVHHFVYIVALGVLGLAVALVADLINSARSLLRDESATRPEAVESGYGESEQGRPETHTPEHAEPVDRPEPDDAR